MGNLLFVDDDASARKRAADQLRARKFSVEEADDGASALAKVKDRLFDVVITDLIMPKMDGLQLMTTLQEANYPAEVVVVTAAGTVENAVAALKLGAFDFVVKPYDVDELAIKVQNALERRRLKSENERLVKENAYLRQIESLTKDVEVSNAELKKKVSELTTIHHISMLLQVAQHEGELFGRLMDFIGRTFPVEDTAMFLLDPAPGGPLRCQASTGAHAEAWKTLAVPADRGMFGEALIFGEPLVVNDAGADARFDRSLNGRLGCTIRSLLCVPLRVKQKSLGVLVLANKTGEGAVPPRFAQEEIALAGMIAREGALTLENFRLRGEVTEKVRMEEELRLGQQIQESFFPKGLPPLAGWSWEARSRPARVVGGDFYWAAPATDHVDLAVGDVSGKGVPAALYMAKVMAVVQAEALPTRSPADILEAVNVRMMERGVAEMFATLLYLRVQSDGRVEWANAGHPPALRVNAGVGTCEELRSSSRAVGLTKGSTYENASMRLGPGDRLVMFTDGYFEAADAAGRPYGMDRLTEAVIRHGEGTPAAVLEALTAEVLRYAPGEFQDDLTMVVMRKD